MPYDIKNMKRVFKKQFVKNSVLFCLVFASVWLLSLFVHFSIAFISVLSVYLTYIFSHII